ncbi:MAG TPA: dihydrolipoyl dehydrogenase [Candidatus Aquicultor sp.]
MERYEIAIIGAGPAGYVGAIRAARTGVPVCLIEEGRFGGVCLNTGCIPTKTLIASSRVLRHAYRASEFGIQIDGSIALDTKRLIERKDKVVEIERQGIMRLVEANGATLIQGHARFIDTHTLRITGPDDIKDIRANNIIIATGSTPKALPFLPFDGVRVFSSDDVLRLTKFPKSLLIIGGGYIGCEFSSMLRPFGVELTIIEAMDRLIPNVDTDIADILAREFKKDDIKVRTGVKITGAKVNDTVTVRLGDGSEATADTALVSIGRRPLISGLGLDDIGVIMKPDGSIIVDSHMMTNVPGVFAVGDVIGNPMLAHVASAECSVAVANALGNQLIMDYTVIPGTIYTNPEIGTIGLTEAHARSMGMDVRAGVMEFRKLGISHAIGEISGMAKIVADAVSDAILGAHVIGDRAADIIHEVAVAMLQGMTASALSRVIHAHPTASEVIMEASQDVQGRAIYTQRKAA